MATNFFELATTLNNLGAKWLSEKKNQFHALVFMDKSELHDVTLGQVKLKILH